MGNKLVEKISSMTTTSKEVGTDILVMNFTIVNACIVGNTNNSNGWVLIDTGLENSADYILECAEKRFGKESKPKAIILTHGHFDHVGSVIKLSKLWNVPVYIHRLEMPYVTGKKDYPLADPSVGGGAVAKMSESFPHTSIDIGEYVVPLPTDGSVPEMIDWQWIHTPGHTEGHVSLFRERDRILLAGDALCTVKQESLVSVATQKEQISGPPKYLTTDWKAAEDSIKHLKELNPSIIVPSHGQPIQGEEVKRDLEMLVNNFDEIAKPEQGKFVYR
ncbi:MBL fold metallo-hydrolase [Clostridium oryzae]|uniref:Putative metallo-hydrolase YflN n=1 Tax=Clostridium oryzae TaxID=1450648 RepID=A0A1V4IKG0_9CLOT|nr:MBL fold metallo-hydrolase [Clostridium oryzae]OPJ60393.1 putative metallo-hydrolase YflN [Clostridium oryzae]